MGADPAIRAPVVLHATSGATGKPQTLLSGPKGRTVGNLLVARMARWQGLGADDVVHSVHGHGMISGGHHSLQANDWYGVGDTGCIAGEGQKGDMIVICLYKDDIAPCIRFNTHDVSAFRTDDNATGMVLRRIEVCLGRSDNMVKLKGFNVFPHAIGALIENRAELTGEYVCRMTRDAKGNDTMTVTLEHRAADSDISGLAVVLTDPGGTAAAAQIDVRKKPIRLIDERGL